MAIKDEKDSFSQSPSTTFRQREPTNKRTNEYQPNMAFDYSKQRRVVPDTLGESIRSGQEGSRYRTMNASGKPFALGVTTNTAPIIVGSAPEDRSRGFKGK